MSYSVAAQIEEAKRWVGFHEGPGNQQPFTSWQFSGSLRNLAWCGSFADWCAVEKGGFRWSYAQLGYKGNAYVPAAVTASRRMGTWRSAWTRAQPGWQVIFDWNRDGEADHIETVVMDDGHKLITIGGNTSDAVLYRTRDRLYLMGFCALNMAGQGGGTPAPTPHPQPQPQPQPKPQEEDMLMVVTPHKGTPKGRTACAVLIPALNCVLLKNGARIDGDKKNGPTEYVWIVPGNGKPVSMDKRLDGKGIVVLKEDNGTFDGIFSHL